MPPTEGRPDSLVCWYDGITINPAKPAVKLSYEYFGRSNTVLTDAYFCNLGCLAAWVVDEANYVGTKATRRPSRVVG